MKNGIEVFDFKEEDELPEFSAGECLSKFKKPKIDDSGTLKYEFLVARSSVQRKEVNDMPCLDIDTIDYGPNSDAVAPFVPPNAGDGGFSLKERSGLHVSSQLNSLPSNQQAELDKDNFESRSSFPQFESRHSCAEESLTWRSQLSSALSDSPSSYKSVDAASDTYESMRNNSPSSPALDEAENDVSLEGGMSDHCLGNVVLDNENETVNIYPDYVSYRDNYCTGSLVIFSHGGIKIERSATCDDEESFRFERRIDDIVKIVFQWSQKVGYVLVKLHVLSKDVLEGENCGAASGIEEVVFSVYEPNWSDKQELITSLNIKFIAICEWDAANDQEAGVIENDLSSHKCYLPNFDEPFDEVIYPKGDSDAVSISKRDVDLLEPETFINDTIIDFYIKYLKNQIPPEKSQRFHFFNSFFFRKLADLDKDPSSISDGRAAFLRVHKWTRKVDLFKKDYIFIPVNFNLHWSLIVICHPGEAALTIDEDKKSPKVPCILHMDSIRGSHAGLQNLVQSYLWEEWKGRHKETSEDLSSRFMNLRFVSLELPQQDNSFDCGLFLLHYLELFLEEAPINFNPFKITKWTSFLNVTWFPPTEASLKRTHIQKIIFELLEIRHQEIISVACNDEPSKFPERNDTETGIEFLSQSCTSEIACGGNLPNSQADRRIEMTLLETSSMRKLHCDNDSGMVLREFFDPGTLLERFPSFGQSSSYYHLNDGAVSPTELDTVGGAEFAYNYQPFTGIGAQDCASSYASRGLMNDTSWNPGTSRHGEHSIDPSRETSCTSDDDDDIGIIEIRPGMPMEPCEKDQRSPLVEETEGLASPSGELVTTSGTEVWYDADRMQDGNEEDGDLPLSGGNPTILLQQDPSGMVNQSGPDSLKELVASIHSAEASEDANRRQNDDEDGDLRPSEENLTQLAVLACGTEASVDAGLMQNDNEDDKDLQSPEENQIMLPKQNPGFTVNQLNQDSDSMENKESIHDGLLTVSDEQQPTKRTRLRSFQEGEVNLQNPSTTANQLDQGYGVSENTQAICNDMHLIEDGLVAESDEQQPAKKIRLMSPDGRKVDESES